MTPLDNGDGWAVYVLDSVHQMPHCEGGIYNQPKKCHILREWFLMTNYNQFDFQEYFANDTYKYKNELVLICNTTFVGKVSKSKIIYFQAFTNDLAF